MKLDNITVRGYKSIRELEQFPLGNLNILIGANGAGKSNFISLFRLLAALAQGKLHHFIQLQGGPDTFLFGGRKLTQEIDIGLSFGQNDYRAILTPTADNRIIFEEEQVLFARDYVAGNYVETLGTQHAETKLKRGTSAASVSSHVINALDSWRVYHFHDTGETAPVKRIHASNDNLLLKPDASNLAAYIARIRQEYPLAYRRIVDTIQLAAPFFGDFVSREPLPKNIELEWTERGDPDTPHRAHILSDGTLRFICLTTLLLQPVELLPDTILIDEPELGLHPFAINLLAEMLKQVATAKQIIVSTQSVELLNAFEPEDVIVVDRFEGASTFLRLDRQDLTDWLEEYTMGELWKRNILGGRPTFAGARL